MKITSHYIFALCLSACASSHAVGWPKNTSEPNQPHGNNWVTEEANFDRVEMLFASGSTALSEAAKAAIMPLVNRVKYSSSTMLTLAGHSDARGSKNRNLVLSLARANTVRNFLINQGVRPENVRVQAFGESRAAVNIQQSENLVKDRRVVVTVEQVNKIKLAGPSKANVQALDGILR